jgi:hypothetical protein
MNVTKPMHLRAAVSEIPEAKPQVPQVSTFEDLPETNRVFQQWFESWSTRRHEEQRQSE